MKQKWFIFILLITGFSQLFAQYEFMQTGLFIDFNTDTNIIFSAPNRVVYQNHEQNITRTGIYGIDHEHGVPFLNLRWEDGRSERYLMLIGEEFMLLYSDNTTPTMVLNWLIRDHGMRTGPHITIMRSITATSFLSENNLNYEATPERLGVHINRVWAVDGGIGERLYITLPIQSGGSLFISSGYVHFSRPYLFHYNTRPKKIRIRSAHDETQFFDMELRDTPNFQTISLWRYFPEIGWINFGEDGKVIIEILEIFPGTRYNHMCINSILGMWSQ